MAMAKQNIQPQNHFMGTPDFFTFRKYSMIITATAISKDKIKKVAELYLLNDASTA